MNRWDPERVTLFRHLASVLNGIAVDRRRRGPNRRLSKAEESELQEAELPEPPPETGEADFERRNDREDPHDAGRFLPAGVFCARATEEAVSLGADGDMTERAFATEVIRQTEADLAGDDLALDVLALFARGVENPKEQALALGRELLDVLAARKRLERHMRKVRDRLEGVEP
jgi:hypothetical protein